MIVESDPEEKAIKKSGVLLLMNVGRYLPNLTSLARRHIVLCQTLAHSK
jgi:hypothetical protein